VLIAGWEGFAHNLHAERLGVLATRHRAKVLFQACDVVSETSVKNAFDAAMSLMDHPLRGLVCCAGISGDGPSIDWQVEDWKRIHDVNVLGTFICAREVARQMKNRDVSSGSIVLIASMSGHGANKGVDGTAYNASKAAVQQTARSLASEWGSNRDMPPIRVNSVSPGYITTKLTMDTLERPGIRKQWEGDNMLMRISDVDEYRGPVVFLLSDASSFMTAADLRVDGGHTAW
jgi:NAD(P)-dependent dehydrogenase (short-subunit alcohol dehydrogenase family)